MFKYRIYMINLRSWDGNCRGFGDCRSSLVCQIIMQCFNEVFFIMALNSKSRTRTTIRYYTFTPLRVCWFWGVKMRHFRLHLHARHKKFSFLSHKHDNVKIVMMVHVFHNKLWNNYQLECINNCFSRWLLNSSIIQLNSAFN